MKSEAISGKKGVYKVTLVALPARALTLQIVKGVARASIDINKKEAFLQRIYVHSVERTLLPPRVEYIEIYGIDPESGDQVYEKVLP